MGYQPGDLRRTGRGQEVAVVAPKECRNGHPLGPNQVLLGTTVCEQGGINRHHVDWRCRTCSDVIVANGHPEACAPSRAA